MSISANISVTRVWQQCSLNVITKAPILLPSKEWLYDCWSRSSHSLISLLKYPVFTACSIQRLPASRAEFSRIYVVNKILFCSGLKSWCSKLTSTKWGFCSDIFLSLHVFKVQNEPWTSACESKINKSPWKCSDKILNWEILWNWDNFLLSNFLSYSAVISVISDKNLSYLQPTGQRRPGNVPYCSITVRSIPRLCTNNCVVDTISASFHCTNRKPEYHGHDIWY